MRRLLAAGAVAALVVGLSVVPGAVRADEVGSFSNDWTGNELTVEAVPDPDIQGVTCHIVSFSRSVIDRLRKGNWFEDPSNTSISCRQTGPIVIGKIDTSKHGEEVFSERKSLIFKSIAVRRIYDRANDTLIYVVYSRQVKDASAKMAISTVPLFSANPTWTKGKPDR
ncbi:CreA family protein [Nitrospirillum sp. BR 11752]|uniref:CreA family protein n=1 Tax=Nitrospirillum sp. BR 11752 TaxID=3104293 RepID=UPI002EC3C6F9|nr:CreA family protein [Nitrospirillum sp. BR 11752]